MRQEQATPRDDAPASDRAAGHNHRVSAGARGAAKAGPLADVAGRIASALPRRQGGDVRRDADEDDVPARVRRPREGRSGGDARPSSPRAAYAGDDYLGTGKPCRVCGRPVEPTMSRCPHCGAFRVPLYQQVPFWAAVVVLAALVVLLSVAVNSCSSAPATSPAAPGGESSQADDSPVAQDKSALTDALSQGQARIDENAANGTYTVATVMRLQEAMSAGQSVADDAQATEDQVSKATQDISDAVGSLRECPTGINMYSWLDYDTIVNSAQGGMTSNTAGCGTVSAVSAGTDGTTLTVSHEGDPTHVIIVQYNELSAVSGAPAVGSQINFAGTVSGMTQTGDGASAPTLVADYVEVSA